MGNNGNKKNVDCDILIAINSCEKDSEHLQKLKSSEFYAELEANPDVGIFEYYRGSDKVKFENRQLYLPGEERYDKLHVKTYDMINWTVNNMSFNRLVKLDCNFMSYTHVGERTRKKICGLDRVNRTIFKQKYASYLGSNGREFLLRDFHAWSKQKGINSVLETPYWMKEGIWYFCGKCYRINYDFANFISKSSECKNILKQHNVKNILGVHPFAVEDVMIGRMHTAFESKLLISETEKINNETIHNNRT